MNWALLFIGAVGLMCIAHGRRTEQLEGVGRLKRRVYKEVSLAQQAGVDFSKPFDELETVGTEAEWKQSKRSKESGKSYAEAYYNSLRRAWNAVSGVQGVGRAYNVKDADGNVVLTWIEDAAAHVAQERRLEELEKSLRAKRNKLRKSGYTQQMMLDFK